MDRRSDGERFLLGTGPLESVELILRQLPDVIACRREPQVLDDLVLEGMVGYISIRDRARQPFLLGRTGLP